MRIKLLFLLLLLGCANVALDPTSQPILTPVSSPTQAPQSALPSCREWTLETPKPPSNLNDFFAIDEERFVAVGDLGTILRSNDAGKSWSPIETNFLEDLYAIAGDGKYLYASGQNGLFLRSKDNGASWERLSLRSQEPLNHLYATKKKVFVLSQRGTFFHSRDNGVTWLSLELPALKSRTMTPEPEYADYLIPEAIWANDSGLVVILEPVNARIWRSTDDGETFESVDMTGPNAEADAVRSLVGSSSGELFAVGGNTTIQRSIQICGSCTDLYESELALYQSSDQGKTWSRSVIETSKSNPSFSVGGHHPPVTHGYFGMPKVLSNEKGVFVLDGATLFSSENKGKTWTKTNAPEQPGYSWAGAEKLWTSPKGTLVANFRNGYSSSNTFVEHYVTVANYKDGAWIAVSTQPNPKTPSDGRFPARIWEGYGQSWIVGEKGLFLEKKDNAWKKRTLLTAESLQDAWGLEKLRLIVATGGKIFRSTDSGASFQEIQTGTKQTLFQIWGLDTKNIFIAGDGALLQSTDEGLTWKTVKTVKDSRLISLWGPSSSELYVLGVYPSVLWHTKDGGKTWENLSKNVGEDVRDFYGVGSDLFLLGSAGKLSRSQDGGKTWKALSVPEQSDLRQLWGDSSALYLLAGSFSEYIHRSRDGGASWEVVETPLTGGVSAIGGERSSEPLIVGFDGQIARGVLCPR